MKCPNCGNKNLILFIKKAHSAKWYSLYPAYYHCFGCQHSLCKDSLFSKPRILGYEYHDLNLFIKILKALNDA